MTRPAQRRWVSARAARPPGDTYEGLEAIGSRPSRMTLFPELPPRPRQALQWAAATVSGIRGVLRCHTDMEASRLPQTHTWVLGNSQGAAPVG